MLENVKVRLPVKIDYQKSVNEKLRLTQLNDRRKIKALHEKAVMHQRFMMALSEKNVPRLHQLIRVCLRQKRGINDIVHQLNKAINGVYSPKGYKDLDLDILIVLIVLIAGGPRLLNALHKTNGLPSYNISSC